MKFKLGDYVKWNTCLQGTSVKRKGKIIYIIDSFSTLKNVIESNDFKNSIKKNINLIYNDLNAYRTHESYLISVKRREGQIPSLHWPDVDNLKKVRKRIIKKKIIKDNKELING